MVEAIFDGAQLGVGDGVEVEAPRQVLSGQAVSVLVAAALPSRVGVGEEEIGFQCDADERVLGKLLSRCRRSGYAPKGSSGPSVAAGRG